MLDLTNLLLNEKSKLGALYSYLKIEYSQVTKSQQLQEIIKKNYTKSNTVKHTYVFVPILICTRWIR